MKSIILRKQEISKIQELMSIFPVTAILGPRQCGKTFLSKQVSFDHYFDLENPRDLVRFENPQLTLESLKGTIIIDEIQRKPELFTLLRYLVDNNEKQKYLILGSASPQLVKQTSESLAGRIAYFYLGGLRISDVGNYNINNLWVRGGFPLAYLSETDHEAFLWIDNYITTFLERDIPQLGINIPSATLRKFWMMLSHYHGQVINYSELGRSFGISDMTIRKYIAILNDTFMVRELQPWYNSTKKRLVKRPKIYIRDSGIFHRLMTIESSEQLAVYNKVGASWEGFALECISKSINKTNQEMFFWATHAGAELDLLWQYQGNSWGVEFKYQDAPKKTKSMDAAINDLSLSHLWVIYPGLEKYKLEEKVTVLPLKDIPVEWKYL